MKMIKLLALLLVTIVIPGVLCTDAMGSGSVAALPDSVSAVAEPADIAAGGLRYCLPNGAVAEDPLWLEQMQNEIREFYAQGYRCIELTLGIHDATLYAAIDSDAWKNTMKAVYTVCNEIGMRVQLHMGFINSGEPIIIIDEGDEIEGQGNFRQKVLFATNSVSFEGGSFPGELVLTGDAYNAANTLQAVLAVRYETVDEGKKQVEVIQLPLDDFTGKLVEAVVEEGKEEKKNEDARPPFGFGQPQPETYDYNYVLTYAGAGGAIGEAGETWEITAYYQGINPRNDKSSGFTAKTTSTLCTVDYFSVDGAAAHIDTYTNKVFDGELIEMIKENNGGFMYDGSDGHPNTTATTWSEGLPARFEELNGYDLLDCLGVIYSDYTLGREQDRRLFYDKLEALSSLYCDYLDRMTEWSNSLNTTYIHQAGYSTKVNTMKVMASVQQPEVESLDFRDNIGGYVSVTSAAHMAGSNIISNEMGAMVNTNYGADVTPLIQAINIALASGVNQMILHTTSFKYFNDNEGYMWPGNSLSYQNHPDFNPTIPSWEVMGYVGGYIHRTQAAMQQGTAQRDVAVYMHLYEESEKNADPFKSYEDLMSYGYTFDYLSTDMLAMEAARTIENGVIDPGGGAYKAFVLDPVTLLDDCRMPTQSAEYILKYAEAGIPIIVIGSVPTRTESLIDDAEDLAAIWRAIEATGNMYIVASDADIAAKLMELGIKANAEYSEASGVVNYMRSTESANYYFLYNRGDSYYIEYARDKADANHAISFKGEGQPYQVNPWTGDVTKIGDFVIEDGYTTINAALEVDESTLIIIDKEDAPTTHATNIDGTNDYFYGEGGGLYLRASADGEYEVALSGGETVTAKVSGLADELLLTHWNLDIESWTPTYDYGTQGVEGTETTKTMLDTIKLDRLVPWSEIEGLDPSVSGIGYYTTTFTLDGAFDGAMLELGSVYDVAKVYINGEEVVLDQQALTVDLGAYVTEGENTLLVTVPTGLINILKTLSLEDGINGNITKLDWAENGLYGGVVVTPYIDTLIVPASHVDVDAQGGSQFAEQFASIDTSATGPMVRWWVPGSNLDPKELAREVFALAEEGFAGAELVYHKVYDGGNGDGWMSDQWIENVIAILRAAKECGLQIDFMMTGGNLSIPVDDPSATDATDRQIVHRDTEVVIPPGYDGSAMTVQLGYPDATEKVYVGQLIGVSTAKVVSVKDTSITLDIGSVTSEYVISDAADTFFSKEEVNLNDVARKEMTMEIAFPANDTDEDVTYRVFAYWAVPTGGSFGKMYYVDHLSEAGANAIIAYYENAIAKYPELGELLSEVGGSMFGDSLELTSSGEWSDEMLETFAGSFGYDCMPYLIALFNSAGRGFGGPGRGPETRTAVYDFADGAGEQFRSAYYKAVTQCYIENHVNLFEKWAQRYNMHYRGQSTYGYKAYNTTASLDIAITETESLHYNDHTTPYRAQSGAVHVNGGTGIYSSEVGEIMGRAFMQTWQEELWHMNRLFVSGINQIIHHGYAYATNVEDENETWPGYLGMFSCGNDLKTFFPTFEYLDDYNDWIARASYLLRQGEADIDLAVFNYAYEVGGDNSGFYDDGGLIDSIGYNFDVVSPAFFELENAIVEDGEWFPDSASYKAILFDHQESMPLETLKALVSLADEGLPMVFVGCMPSVVGEYTGSTEEQAAAQAAFDRLVLALSGHGCVALVGDYAVVPEALATLKASPDASYPQSDIMTTHRTDDGVDYYYVANQKVFYDDTRWMNTVGASAEITFRGEGKPYELNLWTGEITPVAEYVDNGDGTITIDVALEANDTRAFAIATDAWNTGAHSGDAYVVSGDATYLYDVDGALTLRATEAGDYATALSGGEMISTSVESVPAAEVLDNWHLKFINYKPAEDETTYWNVEKVVEYDEDIGAVQSFNTLEDYGASEIKSGVGIYTTAITWDAHTASGAYLDLGGVQDLYRLYVNDAEVPGANPLDTTVDIGAYLVSGENTIRVEVASNLYNAVVGVNGYTQKLPSGFGGGTVESLPDDLTVMGFGLLTEVNLIPYCDVTID